MTSSRAACDLRASSSQPGTGAASPPEYSSSSESRTHTAPASSVQRALEELQGVRRPGPVNGARGGSSFTVVRSRSGTADASCGSSWSSARCARGTTSSGEQSNAVQRFSGSLAATSARNSQRSSRAAQRMLSSPVTIRPSPVIPWNAPPHFFKGPTGRGSRSGSLGHSRPPRRTLNPREIGRSASPA